MMEKMSFEEFKKKVEESLVKLDGKTEATRWMKIYEDELPQLYEDGWSVSGAATAIWMGY